VRELVAGLAAPVFLFFAFLEHLEFDLPLSIQVLLHLVLGGELADL
jgi:hypothetical protein